MASSCSAKSARSVLARSSLTVGVRLRVQDPTGHIDHLEFVDLTEAEALRRARARGLQVLAVEQMATTHYAVSGPRSRVRFPLLLFSRELLALLEAGLNLTEALSVLHAKERQPAICAVLAGILSALREGRNFSDVLAASPWHFPEVYVATVRASERTGDLPRALARYIAYQVRFETIRQQILSAVIYPAVLLAIGSLVILFLLVYVVPRFAMVYESSGRDVSGPSALLLSFGEQVYQHWPFVLAGIAVLFVGAVWCAFHAGAYTWLLQQFLRLPGLANKADEFRLARFYWALSLLLAAGIALPRAMGMAVDLLGPRQRTHLAQCRLAVEQGQSLSVSLLDAELAGPVAESLVKVGERSGQVSEMLEHAARFSDEEIARWINWLSRLLEPILMVVIGVLVGTVVVLMYLPIFDLVGSLR